MTTIMQPVRTKKNTLIYKNKEAIKKTLRDTSGIWKNRKIDPLAYQRAMRKSYAFAKNRK